MSGTLFQSLQTVNQHLRARLSRLSAQHKCPTAMVATEFTDLLAELRHSATCLRSLPTAAPDADTANEISEYRSHVQQLGKILPSLQGRLLIEKARLENARTHVAKAAAWAQGSKRTL
jgi:hypothetical protein